MDLSHHAYCLVGGDGTRLKLIEELEKRHKIRAAGNPDFFDRAYLSFAIDDARELKQQAETRPATVDGKKIFIIKANNITAEAQNALLKLLEEPPVYAHFFLIVPSAHLLLPTVKSRVLVIDEGYTLYDIASAEEFLKIAPTKRLDWIKSFMEEISKEKRPKQDAVELIKGLETILAKKGVKQHRTALEAIMLAEKYSTDRAPSMKMLLEYVAINL